MRLVLSAVSMLFLTSLLGADEAQIAKLLKEKGVTVTETKGVVTGVAIRDGKKVEDADFTQIGHLSHLKTLDLNACLTDARLAQLSGLAELESLSTNVADVTDDGLKPLAKLKRLRTLKFFHPGKSFSGSGLAHLAGLPNLQSLTVAGSFAFNDDGLAAVATLTQLREFRTWHAGGTNEGVKKLKKLTNLKSLNLGQRLTYKAPACPNDDTVAIVAEFQSLEMLQLGESRLTFAAIQQLKQLKSLKKLTLDGIDMPKGDVERLQKELPAVKIDWTEPNETYRKRIQALFP
jgi:hypothetical protein